MRKSAFAGLFALGIIVAGGSSSRASAQELLQVEPSVEESANLVVLTSLDINQSQVTRSAPEALPPVEPTPKKYKVADGDSLEKIAKAHKTTWQRLFYKNVAIEHPDKIKIGSELDIPDADEDLAERPLPQASSSTDSLATRPATRSRTRTTAVQQTRGTSAGNSYTPGYCTWYAKNRRPDLPNNLGNANTWVSRAAAQGIATGSAPRAGAIGQQGMHVVYVERVNGDGTVTVSEMNYNGLFVISSRTVPASTFSYIY